MMNSALEDGLPDFGADAAMPAVAAGDPQGMALAAGDAAGLSGGAARVPDSVMKIPVAIQVVIGSARIPLSQVAQLGPGTVITLDQKLGTPASVLVNGKEVAKGELFVLESEGNRLGITITEVVSGAGP